MAMLGKAALAMWWDMAHERRGDFEHWHSHEHFPERLALPGFRRATRWLAADGGEGVFTCYELSAYGDLASPEYQARLNAPTPWSTAMMPHHRGMQRAQCHVLASVGGFTAAHALTLRLPAVDAAWVEAWSALAQAHAASPGLAGLHLLRHETPAIAATTEQRIRGGDGAPEAVAIVCAYDAAALDALLPVLRALPGAADAVPGRFRLSLSALPGDLSDIGAPTRA